MPVDDLGVSTATRREAGRSAQCRCTSIAPRDLGFRAKYTDSTDATTLMTLTYD
jgi:hypothetical protein